MGFRSSFERSTLHAHSISIESLNPVRVALTVPTHRRNTPVEGMQFAQELQSPGLSGEAGHITLSLVSACHSWDAVC